MGGGGDQSSPAVYKGGLYKIDCQITTNKGGGVWGHQVF